tara:strand:+ start:1618 stop:2547 length:930 start_codon:yes stop_codon:yes gene_type:complete
VFEGPAQKYRIMLMIFEIDYDNLVVKKEKVLDREVFTIDNLFKYPRVVSKFLSELEMTPAELNNYPGNQNGKLLESHPLLSRTHLTEVKKILIAHGFDEKKLYREDIGKREISKMWGSRLIDEDVRHKKVKLRYHHGISVMSNPHTDTRASKHPNCTLTGICYLSAYIHGGTGLYRVKKTGMYAYDMHYLYENLSTLSRKIKGVKNGLERSRIIDDHHRNEEYSRFPNKRGNINNSDEYFERLHFFPMKFNRACFFESDMLHSMCVGDQQYYDNDKTRVTMNYSFNTVWNVSPEKIKEIDELKKETADC